MKFSGKAIKILGEHMNLDTATGWYMGMDALPQAQLAAKFMAVYDPEIPSIVQKNDILVGGRNFGNGKIHASFFIGMKVLGIQCIVAESFSTYLIDQSIINGINLLECPGILNAVNMGDEIEVDLETALILNRTQNTSITGTKLSPFMADVMNSGGHFGWLSKKIASRNTNT